MIYIRSIPPLEKSHVKSMIAESVTKEVANTIMTFAVRPRFLTRTGLFLWPEVLRRTHMSLSTATAELPGY
jgi:hypothetical protein